MTAYWTNVPSLGSFVNPNILQTFETLCACYFCLLHRAELLSDSRCEQAFFVSLVRTAESTGVLREPIRCVG